uniref:Uncharacterized protein n=1 Tax=Arundo donax TaxID=35708 RepID=A0A0A9BAP6_ARUDO
MTAAVMEASVWIEKLLGSVTMLQLNTSLNFHMPKGAIYKNVVHGTYAKDPYIRVK